MPHAAYHLLLVLETGLLFQAVKDGYQFWTEEEVGFCLHATSSVRRRPCNKGMYLVSCL